MQCPPRPADIGEGTYNDHRHSEESTGYTEATVPMDAMTRHKRHLDQEKREPGGHQRAMHVQQNRQRGSLEPWTQIIGWSESSRDNRKGCETTHYEKRVIGGAALLRDWVTTQHGSATLGRMCK